MTQPTLFERIYVNKMRMDTYPDTPGWKRTDTSQQAALAVDAVTLRGLVHQALRVRPRTADEVAELLHVDRLAIRPRCSELRALGQIQDSGLRRPNASGRAAIVWEVKAHEPA